MAAATVAAWPDTGPRRDRRRTAPAPGPGERAAVAPAPGPGGRAQPRRAAEGKGREGGGDVLGVRHRAVIEHPEVPEGMTLGVEQGYPHIAPHPRLRHPGVGRKVAPPGGRGRSRSGPAPAVRRGAAGVVAAAAAQTHLPPARHRADALSGGGDRFHRKGQAYPEHLHQVLHQGIKVDLPGLGQQIPGGGIGKPGRMAASSCSRRAPGARRRTARVEELRVLT